MTDYNTRQRRRNIAVGGFVIVAFCAFLWMIFIFGELPIAVTKFRAFTILVNFPSAPGIQKSTPVQYCGYQIGRVMLVSPPQLVRDEFGRKYHQVKVTLAIERQYNDIPSNIDVMLMKRGLGSSYIEFQFEQDMEVDGFLVDGMVLQGETGVGSEFFPKEVQNKIEDLVDAVAQLADNVNSIVGDAENKANIKQMLANMTIATEQATETLKSIKRLSDSAGVTVEGAAENLNGVLAEFKRTLVKINEGDGTAASLLNDGRLYENLLDSSQELQMALDQLKKLAAEAREKGIKIKW